MAITINSSYALLLRKSTLAVVLITMLLLLPGCNRGAQNEAKEFAATFYETVMNKDFNGVLSLCSEDFLKKSSPEEYLQMLNACNKKLGDLKANEFQKCTVTNFMMSGTYYILDYKTEYSKYPAVEQLTLYKRKGEDEIKVLGHHVSSIGFFAEE
ncbi:MAG: hypothetical protein GX039_04785 [Clostridia bacterium]|nr:hypothetical protein [Clostridia bacterium]